MNRILFLALFATACSPVWTRGKRLADAGRFEDATRYWMEALDEDVDAKAPRKGLDRYGPDAVWVHLELAREHEAEQRYEAALQEFEAARTLADELVEYEIDPRLDREDLAAEIDDVVTAFADFKFRQALDAAERHAWLEAVHWWEGVLELRSEYDGVTDNIGAAYESAALEALEARDYALAMAHFEQAVEWTGSALAEKWLDSLEAAMGRYQLSQGSCRTAYELLSEVQTVDSTLPEDIARAEDCARLEIVVQTFERVGGEAASHTDISGLVTDGLTEVLALRRSPYLFLIDPSLADELPPTSGRRYGIRGRISQSTLDRMEPETEVRTVQGTRKVECPSPDGYPTYNPELCDETVALSYDVTRTSALLTVAGSVRAIDPRTGELALTRSLDVNVSHEESWRSPFRMPDGSPANIGTEASETVIAVPAEILEMNQEERALPSDAQLFTEVARRLSEAAADAVLGALDKQEAVPYPRTLDIRPPMLDASQIEFADPPPRNEAPTRVIIQQP